MQRNQILLVLSFKANKLFWSVLLSFLFQKHCYNTSAKWTVYVLPSVTCLTPLTSTLTKPASPTCFAIVAGVPVTSNVKQAKKHVLKKWFCLNKKKLEQQVKHSVQTLFLFFFLRFAARFKSFLVHKKLRLSQLYILLFSH